MPIGRQEKNVFEQFFHPRKANFVWFCVTCAPLPSLKNAKWNPTVFLAPRAWYPSCLDFKSSNGQNPIQECRRFVSWHPSKLSRHEYYVLTDLNWILNRFFDFGKLKQRRRFVYYGILWNENRRCIDLSPYEHYSSTWNLEKLALGSNLLEFNMYLTKGPIFLRFEYLLVVSKILLNLFSSS